MGTMVPPQAELGEFMLELALHISTARGTDVESLRQR